MADETEQQATGPGESAAGAAPPGGETGQEKTAEKKGRRRRRDPLANMEPISSTAAGLKPRELASLSELKRVKKARVRHEGRRVVTDDVRKLKSLSIEPELNRGEFLNHYVEPVRIEYYIPKESRFALETKFLYIPLVDPIPREQDRILREAMEKNIFIDLIEVMNTYPQHITDILESYDNTMDMFERMSNTLKEVYDGREEQLRTVFYLVEVLMDFEPTVAALDFLGDFLSWNVNWLVRQMNLAAMDFSASDKTVSLFIKKRNLHYEENNLPYDERFEILAALFYEQAFPNRGALVPPDDYYLDIFDKRKTTR